MANKSRDECANELESLLPENGDEGAVVSDRLMRDIIKALRGVDD